MLFFTRALKQLRLVLTRVVEVLEVLEVVEVQKVVEVLEVIEVIKVPIEYFVLCTHLSMKSATVNK